MTKRKRVGCDEHRTGYETFVCQHVARGTASIFFAATEASDDNPWPDAWCEKCESVRIAEGGDWSPVSEAFASIKLLCHHCYERRRATLGRPGHDLAVDDPLRRLTYRCATCDFLHQGLPSWGADAPYYYYQTDEISRRRAKLTGDTCVVDGHYFVRGCLEIPILGSRERWSWGAWTSLSERSFQRMMELWDDPQREREPPYFGWFSTLLPRKIYPESLGLKSHVYERAPGERPLIVLEPTDHLLAVDQREGITIERALEMATTVVRETGGTVQ